MDIPFLLMVRHLIRDVMEVFDDGATDGTLLIVADEAVVAASAVAIYFAHGATRG